MADRECVRKHTSHPLLLLVVHKLLATVIRPSHNTPAAMFLLRRFLLSFPPNDGASCALKRRHRVSESCISVLPLVGEKEHGRDIPRRGESKDW